METDQRLCKKARFTMNENDCMKEFVISRHVRTWLPIEYYVKDSTTETVSFYAVHKQSWKIWVDVYQIEESARQRVFSIKAHDIFGLTCEVVHVEDAEIGSLSRDNWFSQSWQVVDSQNGSAAQLVRTSLFLYREYLLNSNGQNICLYSDESSFFKSRLRLHSRNDPKLNTDLILSIGIVLMGQGNSSVAGA